MLRAPLSGGLVQHFLISVSRSLATNETSQKSQRDDGGLFLTGELSNDNLPDGRKPKQGKGKKAKGKKVRKPKAHEKAAKAAGASTATAARAQALVNKRPDLAERVAAGETTITNAPQPDFGF